MKSNCKAQESALLRIFRYKLGSASTYGLLILFLMVHVIEAANDGCWTDWSPCFTGSYLHPYGWQDRRAIKDPDGGNSSSCLNNLTYVNQVEVRECDEEAYKENLPDDLKDLPCGVDEFKCSTGVCIPQILTCNGDNDCEDASDEFPLCTSCNLSNPITICGFQENLSSTSANDPKTVRYLMGIPGVNQFSLGYDLLKGSMKSTVLSMEPLGSCRRVLVAGETDRYYRLPSNVASFSQTDDISTSLGEMYESSYELVVNTQNRLQMEPSFGGLLGGVDGRVGLSQVDRYKTMVTKSINASEIYTAVTSVVSVNVFKISQKSSKYLYLSTDFLQRITELPHTNYSYSLYQNLINDFGTHYVSSGTLGGTFQETYFYSRCWLYSGYATEYGKCDFNDRLLECTNIESAAQFDNESSVPLKCRSRSGKSMTSYASSKSVAVTGGSSSAAGNLQFQTVTSANSQAWMASVPGSPFLVPENFEIKRISELIDSNTIPFENDRRAKVKEYINDAIDSYLGAYDADTICPPTTCAANSGLKLSCTNEMQKKRGIQSTAYLTGTQADYKCMTACNQIPSVAQCSALGKPASLLVIALAFFFQRYWTE